MGRYIILKKLLNEVKKFILVYIYHLGAATMNRNQYYVTKYHTNRGCKKALVLKKEDGILITSWQDREIVLEKLPLSEARYMDRMYDEDAHAFAVMLNYYNKTRSVTKEAADFITAAIAV
jgi:hypothetical protein